MTTIIIYEDNEQLRKSMEMLLLTVPGYSVAGSFADANNAAEEVTRFQPDLVIMDIDMPGIKGTEAVAVVKKSRPETRIVMHTVFEDDNKLFASLCAGACGYILKKISPEKFLQYIEEALAGGSPFSPLIAQKILLTFQQKPVTANDYHLTDRELGVLQLLVKGYTYKAIAAELFIAMDTVRKHVTHIYEKLHVSCGNEAVALAIRQRII